tara:strand:- start:39 stop:257 length:219 start_codon:yes stop_codon:yes gene_type:complete
MTLAAFDIALMKNYTEPKHLLHFQWNNGSEKVYRYALVEVIDVNNIEPQLKQKKDEVGMSQEEIWNKKYNKK